MKFWHRSWNPIVGCTPKSEGCDNCWAKRQYARMKDRIYAGVPFESVRPVHGRFDIPLHWRKPQRIFVCDMSDLFHEDIPHDIRTEIFDVMCAWRWPNKAAEREGDAETMINPGHTYYIVTKRPENIQPWLDWVDNSWPGDSPLQMAREQGWPKHIWMIVTAENQKRFDERVPILLDAPIGIRGVLLEPLLGPIDIANYILPGSCRVYRGIIDTSTHEIVGYQKRYMPVCDECSLRPQRFNNIDWVIIGCETGPARRECKIEWIADIVRQCEAAGVSCFVKQVSINGKVSHNPAEWPEEVRVQEWVT